MITAVTQISWGRWPYRAATVLVLSLVLIAAGRRRADTQLPAIDGTKDTPSRLVGIADGRAVVIVGTDGVSTVAAAGAVQAILPPDFPHDPGGAAAVETIQWATVTPTRLVALERTNPEFSQHIGLRVR